MERFIKVAEQVPALAVLVFVVVVFLKYLKEKDAFFKIFYKEVHEAHLQAREDSRLAIEKNTSATDRLNETLTNIRLDIRNATK